MDKEAIAYCAGLFEGEGSIGTQISKNRPVWHAIQEKYYHARTSRSIKLSISMSDPTPLHIFWDTFEVGNLLGPYARKKSDGSEAKSMYIYAINKIADVKYVMDLMYPWLSPRRRKQYSDALNKYEYWGEEVSIPDLKILE